MRLPRSPSDEPSPVQADGSEGSARRGAVVGQSAPGGVIINGPVQVFGGHLGPANHGSGGTSADGPDEAALARLRAAALKQADVMPSVFRAGGGPAAVAEIAVELTLRADASSVDAEAPFSRTRRRGAELLGRLCGELHGGPFPFHALLDLDYRRWVVLGDPGSGKTTSLRHLARHIVKQTQWTPLLAKVTDLGPGGLGALLERRAPGSTEAFQRAAERGEAAVLLDGLDEALDPVAARQAVSTLESALPGRALLVVTSRIVGYDLPDGAFGELALCPLRRDQQLDLLGRWLPHLNGAALATKLDGLGRLPRLAQLAENPLILTLIARLLREEKELPTRRADLYAEVVRLLLTRGFDPDLKARPFAAAPPPRAVLGWLALHAHGEDADELPGAALHRRLSEAPEAVQRALQGRDLDTFLMEVSRGTGLLEGDQPELGCVERWSFAHRTFREYLAAQALADEVARRGGVAKCGLGSELDQRLQEGSARPALWAEVFALLTGLLAGGEAEALVKRLVEAGETYKPLLYRVLADAEGLKEETVWGVLGLAARRAAWEQRASLLQRLPKLVEDLGTAVRLLGRFARGAEHGADLWWAHHLLVEIGAGRLGEGEDEVRAEAGALARWLFREHRPEDRTAVLAEIERRGWWKRIPAGSFWMGSPEDDKDRNPDEGPRHRVEVVRGFEMLAVPVTNGLYERFDPGHVADRLTFNVRLPRRNQAYLPAYNVSWYEAEAFGLWLSEGGASVRLPAEVEWEYACRGGTESRFWSGSKDQDLLDVGWVKENSAQHPHPVATPPTPRGHTHPWRLHDLHGNVWEWCQDPWVSDYKTWKAGRSHLPAARRGTGEPAAPRVVRGGGCVDDALLARSACRNYRDPRDRYDVQGFRLVRVSPEST